MAGRGSEEKLWIAKLVRLDGSIRMTIPRPFRRLFDGYSWVTVRQHGKGILVEPFKP